MRNFRMTLVALLVMATPALASLANDPGVKILHDYVLTMPKVMAYDTAYRAFNAAAKKDAGLATEAEQTSDEHAPTVADTINKMVKHPKIYAFFQKQGLSQTEAALLPLILVNACTVVMYKADPAQLKDMVSQSQIDFCKANLAKLKTTIMLSGH